MGGEADVLLKVEVALDGTLRATALNPDNPRAVTLADFIEGDVQASDTTAHILLDDLGRVERGEVSLEESSGNAFSVTVDPEGVLVENAVPGFEDWPSYRYRHDEFRHALEQVLTVLEERGLTGNASTLNRRSEDDDLNSARMTQLNELPDKSGGYTGQVEVKDIKIGKLISSKKFSTFYPDNLSRDQVTNAILDAFRRSGQTRDGKFSGDSGLGFEIEGWYRDGIIETAYPIGVED